MTRWWAATNLILFRKLINADHLSLASTPHLIRLIFFFNSFVFYNIRFVIRVSSSCHDYPYFWNIIRFIHKIKNLKLIYLYRRNPGWMCFVWILFFFILPCRSFEILTASAKYIHRSRYPARSTLAPFPKSFNSFGLRSVQRWMRSSHWPYFI